MLTEEYWSFDAHGHQRESTSPAVLVLAFRRPALLHRTLSALRLAQPRCVYINVDGPRHTHPADVEETDAVWDVVKGFDWNCAVVARRSSQNRGLGPGVRDAVSWFLENEGSGVVLEDDVEISPSSLPLAGVMLDKYRADERVGSISLFNPVPLTVLRDPHATVRMSAIPSSQYWGTWRDRWERNVDSVDESRGDIDDSWLRGLGGPRFPEFFRGSLDHGTDIGFLTWEGRWIVTHWNHEWLVATTNRNFSLHIGFSEDATNSTEQPSWYPTSVSAWDGSYVEAVGDEVDSGADRWLVNQRFGLSLGKRFKRRLGRSLPWLRDLYRRRTVDAIN